MSLNRNTPEPIRRHPDRLVRATSSMLWSAWADALGFISELASPSMLKVRTSGRPLTDTFAWNRRIGGKFGVQIELPAGTYSDDTQLRLAVSRSISNGGFDVEAFSRVELPVWPAYALGGGRASRAAATNMGKPNVTWSTNYYAGWTESGGNGAAMRIQPHVLASTDLSGVSYLDDVIRDAVVTHGHPRALVGATIHALCLGLAMHTGRSPRVEDWMRILQLARSAVSVFERDPDLVAFWRPKWESVTQKSLMQEWESTVDECATMLDRVEALVPEVALFSDAENSRRGTAAYRAASEMLGLRVAGTVGSASGTVVASMVLVAAFPGDPRSAAILSAAALGTDTDTIGTMAAAVAGAASSSEPPRLIQDRKYIEDEALRLTRIGNGETTETFSYPDILRWSPPRSQLDVVGLADGRPALAGLGWLQWASPATANAEAEWAWASTSFGPTIVVKRRPSLRVLPSHNWPRVRQVSATAARTTALSNAAKHELQSRKVSQPELFDDPGMFTVIAPASERNMFSLDDAIAAVRKAGLSEESVGHAVALVARLGSEDQLIALVKYLRAPLRHNIERR